MLNRILDIPHLLEKKSFFLFGPRATGKTTLITKDLLRDDVLFINLLRTELYLRLSETPHELESIINANTGVKIVVIDEIQRIPALLNEVHRLIEEKRINIFVNR